MLGFEAISQTALAALPDVGIRTAVFYTDAFLFKARQFTVDAVIIGRKDDDIFRSELIYDITTTLF